MNSKEFVKRSTEIVNICLDKNISFLFEISPDHCSRIEVFSSRDGSDVNRISTYLSWDSVENDLGRMMIAIEKER